MTLRSCGGESRNWAIPFNDSTLLSTIESIILSMVDWSLDPILGAPCISTTSTLFTFLSDGATLFGFRDATGDEPLGVVTDLVVAVSFAVPVVLVAVVVEPTVHNCSVVLKLQHTYCWHLSTYVFHPTHTNSKYTTTYIQIQAAFNGRLLITCVQSF